MANIVRVKPIKLTIEDDGNPNGKTYLSAYLGSDQMGVDVYTNNAFDDFEFYEVNNLLVKTGDIIQHDRIIRFVSNPYSQSITNQNPVKFNFGIFGKFEGSNYRDFWHEVTVPAQLPNHASTGQYKAVVHAYSARQTVKASLDYEVKNIPFLHLIPDSPTQVVVYGCSERDGQGKVVLLSDPARRVGNTEEWRTDAHQMGSVGDNGIKSLVMCGPSNLRVTVYEHTFQGDKYRTGISKTFAPPRFERYIPDQRPVQPPDRTGTGGIGHGNPPSVGHNAVYNVESSLFVSGLDRKISAVSVWLESGPIVH